MTLISTQEANVLDVIKSVAIISECVASHAARTIHITFVKILSCQQHSTVHSRNAKSSPKQRNVGVIMTKSPSSRPKTPTIAPSFHMFFLTFDPADWSFCPLP